MKFIKTRKASVLKIKLSYLKPVILSGLRLVDVGPVPTKVQINCIDSLNNLNVFL
jgi:hypothetical protein